MAVVQVSNNYVANNPDIPVRYTGDVASGYVQHVVVDGTSVISSATLSNVSSSATSVQLVAANASRRGFSVFNDSTQYLNVKFGTTASSTSFTVRIAPGQYYEMPQPVYTGRIDGIWDAANGAARITEM